jgi:hypothetical protein
MAYPYKQSFLPDALVKITGVKLGIKPLLQMLVFLSDFSLHDAPMIKDDFPKLVRKIRKKHCPDAIF